MPLAAQRRFERVSGERGLVVSYSRVLWRAFRASIRGIPPSVFGWGNERHPVIVKTRRTRGIRKRERDMMKSFQ
jgi:hypothetical protein